MGQNSSIEWTESTWNPVTGCSKISAGCKNCYAERLAFRLQAMGNVRYAAGFDITLHDDLIELPKRWRDPRVIFVNSMSDLFQEEVPSGFYPAGVRHDEELSTAYFSDSHQAKSKDCANWQRK